MFYYLIAPLKSNAPLLTYSSTHPHKPFEIITIEIRNKQTQGIIIKETSKPDFECKNIQKSPLAWTELQIQLGNFIAPVSYTHLTLPTIPFECRSRWSPYH